MRELYSAMSGMSATGTKLDVIGDNVTNSSTTAFRSSDVRFKTLMSQNEKDASGPSGDLGGSNPSQVGLGVQVGSIDTIFKSGTLQASGGILDTAIDDLDGNDYYIISKGPADYKDNSVKVSQTAGSHNVNSESVSTAGQNIKYIRAGNFSEDQQGNIVTSDGYRVMGYSLSNDTANQDATAVKPGSIRLNGFTFSFGPGTDLNKYKIELGDVGQGTSVTAKIDTSNNKIILNGDFSEDNQVSASQAEEAINGALSSSGIAQTVLASGASKAVGNIVSDSISGGLDNSAPSSVSVGGFTFDFEQGAALDGYKITLGNINEGTPLSVDDIKNRVITINGDFVTSNAVTKVQIMNAINSKLAAAGIAQKISSVDGNPVDLSSTLASTDSKGSIPKAVGFLDKQIAPPRTAKPNGSSASTIGGLDFSGAFTDGGELNGYTFKLGSTSASTSTSVSVDTSAKTVTLNFDSTNADGNGDFISKLTSSINAALTQSGITQPTIKDGGITLSTIPGSTTPIKDACNSANVIGTGTGNDYDPSFTLTDASTQTGNTEAYCGADLSKPSDVSIDTLSFSFNYGTTFNNYKVQLGDVGVGTTTSASIDTNKKVITINGDFITSNAVTTSDINNALTIALGSEDSSHANAVYRDELFGAGAGTAVKDDGTAGTSADVKITVSGDIPSLNNISSDKVSGGTDASSPNAVKVGNFNISFGNGAALNGYKFEIGTIDASNVSADIDTNKRVITINGDFTSDAGVSSGDVSDAITAKLKEKSINQTINIANSSMRIGSTISDQVTGGTPAQSIDNDGTINFVDGTKNLYAYDTSLKALRIPRSVYNIATGEYSDVKSFSIDQDGVITTTLADGSTAAIGQMAMAKFVNQGGLEKIGDNMYQETANSGNAIIKSGINTSNDDNSGAFGSIMYHELEGSNVDLAEQFTNMIVTERAFQADGKIISTGDDVLQDIIDLKR